MAGPTSLINISAANVLTFSGNPTIANGVTVSYANNVYTISDSGPIAVANSSSNATVTGAGSTTVQVMGLSSLSTAALNFNLGPQSNTISVQSINDPTTVNSQDTGVDTYLVGNSTNGVQGIAKTLTLQDSVGKAAVTIDDSADVQTAETTPQIATLAADNSSDMASITGLAPGGIQLVPSGLHSLDINAGSGVTNAMAGQGLANSFTVTGTPAAIPTTLNLGGSAASAFYSVNLTGTASDGPLTINGQAGSNDIYLGEVDGSFSTGTSAILGQVVINPSGATGKNNVTVDDSTATTGVTATLSAITGGNPQAVAQLGGVTAMPITYDLDGSVKSVRIVTGSGDDTLAVVDFAGMGGPLPAPFSIDFDGRGGNNTLDLEGPPGFGAFPEEDLGFGDPDTGQGTIDFHNGSGVALGGISFSALSSVVDTASATDLALDYVPTAAGVDTVNLSDGPKVGAPGNGTQTSIIAVTRTPSSTYPSLQYANKSDVAITVGSTSIPGDVSTTLNLDNLTPADGLSSLSIATGQPDPSDTANVTATPAGVGTSILVSGQSSTINVTAAGIAASPATFSATGGFANSTLNIDAGASSPVDVTAGTVTVGSQTFSYGAEQAINFTNAPDQIPSFSLHLPAFTAGAAANNVSLATLTVADPYVSPAHYAITIDWGDGTTSTGTASSSGANTFDVLGSHTYAAAGSFTIKIAVATNSTGGTVDVGNVPVTTLSFGNMAPGLTFSGPVNVGANAGGGDVLTGTGNPATTTVVAGQTFTGQVATFQDTNLSAAPADFTASINWGDGTTSPGSVVGSVQFGGAGSVIIGGDDADTHGDFSGTVNEFGWLYMQKALEAIVPNVKLPSKTVVALGTPPEQTGTQGAGAAIDHAFDHSALPSLGWRLVHVFDPSGSTSVLSDFLSGRPVTAEDETGAAVPNFTLAGTGLLYITSVQETFNDQQVSDDLTGDEAAVLDTLGPQIRDFVNSGGGLFTQTESNVPTGVAPYGWLTTLFPGITVDNSPDGGGFEPQEVTLTPTGMSVLPGLQGSDLATGPVHNFFGGNLGPLAVAATVTTFETGSTVENLILTSTGTGGGGNGMYIVNGTHVYQTPGAFTATATLTAVPPRSASATATSQFQVLPPASLTVAQVASPAPATPGTNLTYTVTVTNPGAAAAPGVVLTDTLPAGVTFVSATGGALPTGQTLTIPLGDLAAGGTATVTIVVLPARPGSISNTVVAASPSLSLTGTSTIATAVGNGFVTTEADTGVGSLRQFILDLDAAGQGSGSSPVTITFNIPGAGAHIIRPVAPLPPITRPVIIDGTTQPGFAGVPLIEIDGSGAGASTDGFVVDAGHSMIRGLSIVNFGGSGIVLDQAGGDIIASNYVGVDATGAAAPGNGVDGIEVEGTGGNMIGLPGQGNVIAGNQAGIYLFGGASGNLVAGNRIGIAAAGMAALPNQVGVAIADSSGNFIGGPTADMANIIADNTKSGVIIFNSAAGASDSATGNVVTSNVIMDNGQNGVYILNASGNVVGTTPSGTSSGSTPAGGNTIVGNGFSGVEISVDAVPAGGDQVPSGAAASGNIVQGNLVMANRHDGIYVFDATGNLIGQSGAGNTIDSNGFSGVHIDGSAATGNLVMGNAITNSVKDGVQIDDGTANIIGGTGAAANQIVGSGSAGIQFLSGGRPGAMNDMGGNIFAGSTSDSVEGPTQMAASVRAGGLGVLSFRPVRRVPVIPKMTATAHPVGPLLSRLRLPRVTAPIRRPLTGSTLHAFRLHR